MIVDFDVFSLKFTFRWFAYDDAKPAIIFLIATYLDDESIFDDGTKDALLLWPKPLGFSQFLHGYAASKCGFVVSTGHWPPFQSIYKAICAIHNLCFMVLGGEDIEFGWW